MVTGHLHVNRDIILASRRQFLQERKKRIPTEAVLAMAQMQSRPRPILNTMHDYDSVALIAQITRTPVYDPVTAALTCVQEGAQAIAFFTDHALYHGDYEDMLMVARGVRNTPVICQNYMPDEYSVLTARSSDASALVLHSSVLDDKALRQTVVATQKNKMVAIVQISHMGQLGLAQTLSPHAIAFGDDRAGTLEDSLTQLSACRDEFPAYTQVLLSHCLETVDEVEAALQVRVHAIIVSESLMRQDKKIAKIRRLINHPMAT
jgi:indole-3-glycerol phosphate synthase